MSLTKRGSSSFEDDDNSGLDDLAADIAKEKEAAKAKAIQQAAADEAVAAQQASVLAAQKVKIDRQNQEAANEAAAAQQVAVEKAAAVAAAQKAEDDRAGAAAQEAAQAEAAQAAATKAAADAATAAYVASLTSTASTGGGGYDYIAPVTSGRTSSDKANEIRDQNQANIKSSQKAMSDRPRARPFKEGGLIQKSTTTKKPAKAKTNKRGLAARK